jgi:hypothetical protein
MMLGFYPKLDIDRNWATLAGRVTNVAHEYVHNNKYMDHVLYENVNSIVAELPTGGWISKSGPSYDFFVMGGIPETQELDTWFQTRFPTLTFTPATICWSSQNVPRHKDNIKNGQSSLVYPIKDNSGYGIVYGENEEFRYETKRYTPVVINITTEHEVIISKPRVWFSIHMQESIEMVKKVLDQSTS